MLTPTNGTMSVHRAVAGAPTRRRSRRGVLICSTGAAFAALGLGLGAGTAAAETAESAETADTTVTSAAVLDDTTALADAGTASADADTEVAAETAVDAATNDDESTGEDTPADSVVVEDGETSAAGATNTAASDTSATALANSEALTEAPTTSTAALNATAASAATYQGTVSVVGGNTFTVTSGDDVIPANAAPAKTGSSFFSRYLMGYGLTADAITDPNGEIFAAGTPMSTVFPDGVAGDATLYALYFSAFDAYSAVTSGGGTVTINENWDEPTDTLPGSGVDIVLVNGTPTLVTGEYDPATGSYPVNLEAQFAFERALALFSYYNPGGLLTNSGDWASVQPGAKYTHVDLSISLDDEIILDDVLNLEFTSHAFKVHAVLVKNADGTYSRLAATVDAPSAADLSQNFSFDPQGHREFIIRTSIKNDGNPAYTNRTHTVEEILSAMVLRSTDPRDFSISKETAARLAASDGTEVLTFTGFIEGIANPAGLGLEIARVDANVLDVTFVDNEVTEVCDSCDLADISGSIFIDSNGNAFFDFWEWRYRQPVTVTLLLNGEVVQTVVTTNGNFQFSELADGIYEVDFGGAAPTRTVHVNGCDEYYYVTSPKL